MLLERSIVSFTYTYDMVQLKTELHMPLFTKAKIEVITLQVAHHMIFSTHASLVWHGKEGVRQLSDRCKHSYSLYTDKLLIYTGGSILGNCMDYAKGHLVEVN